MSDAHRLSTGSVPQWITRAVFVACCGAVVSVCFAYGERVDSALERLAGSDARYHGTEQRQASMESRLSRIEDKLDRLIEKLVR